MPVEASMKAGCTASGDERRDSAKDGKESGVPSCFGGSESIGARQGRTSGGTKGSGWEMRCRRVGGASGGRWSIGGSQWARYVRGTRFDPINLDCWI